MVPMLETGIEEISTAEVVMVIGSSMQVYPAASLVAFAPHDADIYYIDPHPQINTELAARHKLKVISKPATLGVREVITEYLTSQS
jgi:NAD-dependent deacetylase